jgi:hypothetical protein
MGLAGRKPEKADLAPPQKRRNPASHLPLIQMPPEVGLFFFFPIFFVRIRPSAA